MSGKPRLAGAQLEMAIDGKPLYRDTKAVAIEAAEYLKRRHPNNEVVVKDLQTGEVMIAQYKPDLGR